MKITQALKDKGQLSDNAVVTLELRPKRRRRQADDEQGARQAEQALVCDAFAFFGVSVPTDRRMHRLAAQMQRGLRQRP